MNHYAQQFFSNQQRSWSWHQNISSFFSNMINAKYDIDSHKISSTFFVVSNFIVEYILIYSHKIIYIPLLFLNSVEDISMRNCSAGMETNMPFSSSGTSISSRTCTTYDRLSNTELKKIIIIRIIFSYAVIPWKHHLHSDHPQGKCILFLYIQLVSSTSCSSPRHNI